MEIGNSTVWVQIRTVVPTSPSLYRLLNKIESVSGKVVVLSSHHDILCCLYSPPHTIEMVTGKWLRSMKNTHHALVSLVMTVISGSAHDMYKFTSTGLRRQ